MFDFDWLNDFDDFDWLDIGIAGAMAEDMADEENEIRRREQDDLEQGDKD
ncbi:MAG: hypothetical protein V1793_07685 [Pseudomonadota bacterium]